MSRLLVACPSLNFWDADTSISWAECRGLLASRPVFDCVGFMNPRSSDLVTSRTLVARRALSDGWDWVFWFDSDVVFPPDAVHRLFSHGLPIVSGVARVKGHEYSTYALTDGGDCVDVRSSTGLVDLDGITGFGCILTSASIFREVPEPWFGGDWEPGPDGVLQWRFEDGYFCKRARGFGYRIVVDCDLSKELGHKGSCSYEHGGVRSMR